MLIDIFSSLDYYTYVDEKTSSFVMGYFFFYMGVLGVCPNKGKNWVGLSPFSVISTKLDMMLVGIVSDSGGMRFGGLVLGSYGIFWVLLSCNFGGMVPAGFSISSQLSMGLGLSFVWWFWPVLSAFCFNWKEFLAHFLPLGTPLLLCPLMVLIESTSVLIRPITLAVRLVANITMGHLVMSLMGTGGVIGVGSLVFGGYVLFEFFVCGLQAYVFTLLVNLYSMDHPSHMLH
uniref:ATP synthase subunit a n=1 Tax=Unio tumidus TaxID=143298 RepID=A0A1Q1MMN5_9BIVA|nr:ATP synthase F0 subunit 6 [Unio tumidus]AQM37808.1 ATP synthase F0 subunit 6 [Unio tumidus]AQM37822.1 ATP synthase F0 subunit 6 [Unio tumidus]